jgi:hypothetical protein
MRFAALAIVIMVTLLAGNASRPAYAASYEPGGVYDACVSQSFDGPNGWVNFHNGCSVPVSVMACYKAGPYGCITVRVRSGSSNSGYDTRSELAAHGDFELYICRSSFVAVDANDLPIASEAVSAADGIQFRCKYVAGAE